MLEALSGVITLANLLLALVIGVRLLRRRPGVEPGPERWLALFFLLHSFLGALVTTSLYVGWSNPEAAIPDAIVAPVHAAGLLISDLGLIGIWMFTWRTFRPGSRAARRAVVLGVGAMLAGYAGIGLVDHFAILVLPGPVYWFHWLLRQAPLVWVTVEAFRYWRMQRKRVAHGLADPVVANRFLLWSLWGGALLLTTLSDPVARVWYYALTGTTDRWIPALGQPIVVFMIAVSSVLGIGSATSLLLTFFPGERYRRWLAGRARS